MGLARLLEDFDEARRAVTATNRLRSRNGSYKHHATVSPSKAGKFPSHPRTRLASVYDIERITELPAPGDAAGEEGKGGGPGATVPGFTAPVPASIPWLRHLGLPSVSKPLSSGNSKQLYYSTSKSFRDKVRR